MTISVKARNEKLKKYTTYFGDFCQECLRIKTEEGTVVPLKLNSAQRKVASVLISNFIDGKPNRLIILKARREGISTLVAAYIFWRTAMMNNTNAYVISHNDVGVSYLFDIYRLYYDALDPDIKPMKRHDNAKILKFENPDDKDRSKSPGRRSEIRVGSAGDKNIGSGYTTHLCHFSELAKCEKPEDMMMSIRPSIPPGGDIIIESTAFGVGNYFHREWLKACNGESEFFPLFFPWFEHDKYQDNPGPDFKITEDEKRLKGMYNLTDRQLAWRRNTVRSVCDGDKEYFKQEYPASDREAFLSTGRSVFSPSVLDWYEARPLPAPAWVGEVEIVTGRDGKEVARLEKRDDGRVKFWGLPDKIKEKHFCIGCDVSEGIDIQTEGKRARGDRSAFHIFERDTGALVGKFVGWVEPDTLGKMLYAVGKFYNNAYIGVEANNYGLLVLTTLRDMGYDMTQIHHTLRYGTDFDDQTEKMGWWTSQKSKAMLITELSKALRDREFGGKDEKTGKFYGMDLDTLSEFRTYCRNDRGKLGATGGCYDDQVMSAGIGWMMVLVSRDYIPMPSKVNKEIDDFNNAGRVNLSA